MHLIVLLANRGFINFRDGIRSRDLTFRLLAESLIC